MSKQAGILKVIHAVSDLSSDPGRDESLFDSGALDSWKSRFPARDPTTPL